MFETRVFLFQDISEVQLWDEVIVSVHFIRLQLLGFKKSSRLQPSLSNLPLDMESQQYLYFLLGFSHHDVRKIHLFPSWLRISSSAQIWVKQTYEKHFSFSCASFFLVRKKPSISIKHKFSNYAIRTTRLNICPSDGSTSWIEFNDPPTVPLIRAFKISAS